MACVRFLIEERGVSPLSFAERSRFGIAEFAQWGKDRRQAPAAWNADHAAVLQYLFETTGLTAQSPDQSEAESAGSAATPMLGAWPESQSIDAEDL